MKFCLKFTGKTPFNFFTKKHSNIYKFHQIWRTVSDLPPPPAIPSPPHLTEMSDVQTDLDRRCTAPWFLWIWVVGQAYVFGRLDGDAFFNGMGRRRGFWQFFRKKINLEILSHHFQMLEITTAFLSPSSGWLLVGVLFQTSERFHVFSFYSRFFWMKI